MKWHHSRYCRNPQGEEFCECGHPKCLHVPVRQDVRFSPEACRSLDCDGQCEVWDPT